MEEKYSSGPGIEVKVSVSKIFERYPSLIMLDLELIYYEVPLYLRC